MSVRIDFPTKYGNRPWLNYIAFNGMFLFVLGYNLLLLTGLIYYPFQVGFYCLLPYFSYAFLITRSELKEGSRWRKFSENFPPLQLMREHLQLNFYLPSAMVEAEKKKDAQFIFAVFPHGTSSDYRVAMDGMLHKVLPNICEKMRVLAASVLFMIPVVREIALWTGCIDARRPVAESVLLKGYSVVVLPGGESEQIRTVYRKEHIFVKARKGFIKLGMQKKIPVVPVYVFGVHDYYYTSNLFFGPRLWLQKKVGVCIPLAVGLWGSIFCPLPVKTTVVFGEPLLFECKTDGKPTTDELDDAHDNFCRALQNLFESHKKELGFGDRALEIS